LKGEKIMGQFGGFYKGEKRKPKKEKSESKAKKINLSPQTTFTLPVILQKGKGTR
jgi:hypothetical protein